MHPVPTFSEIAVREALLNAVSHRDYRHPGSVFVRQFTRHIEIVSPGGFPPGITPDNILRPPDLPDFDVEPRSGLRPHQRSSRPAADWCLDR